MGFPCVLVRVSGQCGVGMQQPLRRLAGGPQVKREMDARRRADMRTSKTWAERVSVGRGIVECKGCQLQGGLMEVVLSGLVRRRLTAAMTGWVHQETPTSLRSSHGL